MPIQALLSGWRRFAATNPRNVQYTVDEVRHLLKTQTGIAHPSRARAVRATASTPGAWTDRLDRETAWKLGWISERLPMIVFFYTSGLGFEEISRRIGSWSAWEAERALDAACACIADRLNDRRLPAVRGASEDPSGERS